MWQQWHLVWAENLSCLFLSVSLSLVLMCLSRLPGSAGLLLCVDLVKSHKNNKNLLTGYFFGSLRCTCLYVTAATDYQIINQNSVSFSLNDSFSQSFYGFCLTETQQNHKNSSSPINQDHTAASTLLKKKI